MLEYYYNSDEVNMFLCCGPNHLSHVRKVNEEPESIASAEAEGNALCQYPLHSPHQGFWTLVVLKLLDQSHRSHGQPARIQQSC